LKPGASSTSSSSAAREFRRFAVRIALFAICLLAIDRLGFGSQAFAGLLYRYRPHAGTISTYVGAQRQVLAMDYLSHIDQPEIVFVGSSSVVNGVDAERIQAGFAARGRTERVFNFGVTGLLASGVPMLKRDLIRPNMKTLVYLYNTFAFPDELWPGATEARWSTSEFLRIARPSQWFAQPAEFTEGLLGEVLVSSRYRDLIQVFLQQWLSGVLVEATDDYDYESTEATPVRRPRVPQPAAPESDWSRRMYTSSDTDVDTLGYRGLRRFLQLAKQAGVHVIVMPAPEPEFARYEPFEVGVNVERIDRHVAAICAEAGVAVIPRGELASIERHDEYFRDAVHLHWTGRRVFSDFLVSRLADMIGRP